MSEDRVDSTEYERLRDACKINGLTVELYAYEDLLHVRNFYANAAKAVLRSLIAETCGFEDEFVQVTCETRLPME